MKVKRVPQINSFQLFVLLTHFRINAAPFVYPLADKYGKLRSLWGRNASIYIIILSEGLLGIISGTGSRV